MIQLPRRSVARFFIPLIDVMTLLFCIFLLMPLVKPVDAVEPPPPSPGEATDASIRTDDPPDSAPSPERTAVAEAQRELHRLRTERIETLQQRLTIRVLEIDADSGKLYYFEPEQRVEITSQADARRLVERDRQEAPGKENYYLILFPRRLTGFPQEKQVTQYERWFEGVAHGFDNPRAGR
jgi:hypothetical protein